MTEFKQEGQIEVHLRSLAGRFNDGGGGVIVEDYAMARPRMIRPRRYWASWKSWNTLAMQGRAKNGQGKDSGSSGKE